MKKICVFTGSRAEYGLLWPLMQRIKQDRCLELQLVVSGMHLAPDFGQTYRQIEHDGFCIDAKVEISLTSDTPIGISRATGSGIAGIAKAYSSLKPDLVVILGDRFETFAAAQAAMFQRIPIAHICGGEATYGLIDEAIRHCITKMSHLHFCATSEYRKRVIQLGEVPQRVFCTGSPGIDNIKALKLLSRNKLQKQLGIRFKKYTFLITFHPVTLENNTSKEQFGNLLKSMDKLNETTLLFTKANADTYGRVINRMIDGYVARKSDKAKAFTSMGQLLYLSAMKYSDAVVGNSSSGIIEAPSFKIGTINIGNRQAGRIRAESVIDCQPQEESIDKAFKKLYSPEFKKVLRGVINPYGSGDVARKIVKVLKGTDLNGIIIKKFHDIAPEMKNKQKK